MNNALAEHPPARGPFGLALAAVERGLLPDPLVRAGIRRLLRQRLAELAPGDCQRARALEQDFITAMNDAPVAPLAHKANEQHYELPAEFFHRVLGEHLKYSCCCWDDGVTGLDQAEALALRLSCERAAIENGMTLLELGCGWGSLSLWLAQHYPDSAVVAVSNSRPQREFIERRAAERGLGNLTVFTADMNHFTTEQRFDRVVSVEMFEHMRNYRLLFDRVADWLHPGGRFFMHIFCHRAVPYAFVPRDASDWMSRYFFSGGMMPSDALPLHFAGRLRPLGRWRWDGTHYRKTADAWLARMDRQRTDIGALLKTTYGADAGRWWVRWRLFFLAVSELFGYRNGQEWWVSHYLFDRP